MSQLKPTAFKRGTHFFGLDAIIGANLKELGYGG